MSHGFDLLLELLVDISRILHMLFIIGLVRFHGSLKLLVLSLEVRDVVTKLTVFGFKVAEFVCKASTVCSL